ncbi:transglycosylase family protein [Frankia torreyi]|uniref:Transglycosylase family protein n=1 Tax=Frankia torreyi TaxID=1856 RepID=A0A0D8BKJ5_9ACTN|nr:MULTISPECIES: lytic transglycosylase domain-containing protein [Frankia]KJE24620.1 transglycosylase family protein [Frankia torreyi]KQC37582.1 lytic transglycosylase [Frankia sp. ACN1ag]KQM07675.1 transglycosylase family protein [Frankia sp. CpI1-P]
MYHRVSLRAVLAVLLAVTLVASCGILRRTHRVPDDLIPVFRSAATAYGILTPAQLAAQARVESKFDARAVSHAGARGIMQFLPTTWAAFGLDGNEDGVADPLDPRDAILSAAYYESRLAEQVAHLPGDRVSLILAAYNAGPDAVRLAGGIPDIGETQAYVTKVRDWADTYSDQL